MRIGHFSNTYIPTVSGVVRQISALRKVHMAQGHQVSVFTQGANGHSEQDALIFRYPTSSITMPMDFPLIFPYSQKVNRYLPSLQLDVIHVHHPFVLGQVALSKAEKLGLPVVFTFHTLYWEHSHFFPIWTPAIQKMVKRWIHNRLRIFMRACDLTVVYTKSMRDMLIRKFGDDNNICVVPTGIDLLPFRQLGLRRHRKENKSTTMVSVGRLSREKNWNTLLEAVYQVVETHPDFKLVLIGDGPQRGELEDLVFKMGISNHVFFVGKVGFDEIARYLGRADLFGFASVTETIGRSMMEAMASGLPVVAVDAESSRNLVTQGKDGLLTDNDSLSLAAGIRLLTENPELRFKFGKAAQQKAKEFDVEVEANRMMEVYYNVIRKRGGSQKK